VLENKSVLILYRCRDLEDVKPNTRRGESIDKTGRAQCQTFYDVDPIKNIMSSWNQSCKLSSWKSNLIKGIQGIFYNT